MKATYYLALIAITIMLFQFTSAAPRNLGDNEDLGNNEDLGDNENLGDNGEAKLRNARKVCQIWGIPVQCPRK